MANDVPADDLKPDFENRDPHPSLGLAKASATLLAKLSEHELAILADPFHGLEGEEREEFETIMNNVLAE